MPDMSGYGVRVRVHVRVHVRALHAVARFPGIRDCLSASLSLFKSRCRGQYDTWH
jgi:hypothetical protein